MAMAPFVAASAANLKSFHRGPWKKIPARMVNKTMGKSTKKWMI